MTASIAALLRNSVAWAPNSIPNYLRNPKRIKIPDLLAEVSETGSEFEVNKHCLWVSEKSFEWTSRYSLQTTVRVDEPIAGSSTESRESELHTELDFLSTTKPALLASLCFPLSDPTPLLLSTDFCSWLLLLQLRLFSLSSEECSLLLKDIISTLDPVNDPSSLTGFSAAIYKSVPIIYSRVVDDGGFSHSIFDRYQKFGVPGDETSSLEHMKNLVRSLLYSFSEKDQESTLDFKPYIAKEREEGWPQLLFLLTRCSLGLKPSDIAISGCSTLSQMESIASEIMVCASVSDRVHHFTSLSHILLLS